MLRIYLNICVVLFSSIAFGQNLILNNNVFFVINDSAKLVITNPSSNAIATAGTGGNIVSEGEFNQVIWQIGNHLGTYNLPFTTKPISQGGTGIKIPMTTVITAEGDEDGKILFSTYETSSDFNDPYPTGISNLNQQNGTDGSLFTIDRFWIQDNSSYTTKPSATLTFTYNPNTDELGGSNTISESDLKAQRWNSSLNSWESLQFGTLNTTNHTVSNISVDETDFWEVWTLQSSVIPLSINLTKFISYNQDCNFVMEWEYSDPTNISEFILEKSLNGLNWYKEASIAGLTEKEQFSYTDRSALDVLSYYKLSSLNKNGVVEELKLLTNKTNCFEKSIELFPNPFTQSITIISPTSSRYILLSSVGQTLFECNLLEGVNYLDLQIFPIGTYYSKFILDDGSEKTIKLIKL